MIEWTEAEREAYLTLALIPGIGVARLTALLHRFETPSGALAAPLELLRTIPGIAPATATAIGNADRRAAAAALTSLADMGGRLLLPADQEFPAALGVIPEPPAHLFALGNVGLLARPSVAIVGSRDHSPYGAEACRRLARAVAEAGLVVVSGMARGLDAVAHAGALEANGGTIGVLGNGLGVIYPAANRHLYDQVAKRGLLLTEFPPGERPRIGSFPRRNRVISGLARVVVVVEAAESSGALQTVACALDQGREVLAIPGPITSAVSAGTNRLIRDGAAPLLELDDLLAHFPEVARQPQGLPPGSAPASDPLHARLVRALWSGPRRAEELVEAAAAPVELALDALSALELGGRVRQEAGGLYRLAVPGLFG